MPDPFDKHTQGLESPATMLVAITPDDATDLPFTTRALNVAQAGSVHLTTAAGNTSTVFIAAGTCFPVRASRVWATGTTATGIVGLA